jgi:hypothetical protein
MLRKAIESDEMFRSEHSQDGFDTPENAFFGYFDHERREWRFQPSLEVDQALNRHSTISLRPAEQKQLKRWFGRQTHGTHR